MVKIESIFINSLNLIITILFFFLKDNHKLIVENDEDEIEFIITISDSRNCDPTQNPGKEDEG